MIGNSAFEYLQIRLAITGFRLIAPCSIVYLGSSLIYRKIFFKWLGLYAGIEAAFFILFYVPRRIAMQKVPFSLLLFFLLF